jgi:hypothetical protein
MFSTKHRLLREMAQRSPHIRGLLPSASIVFDALDQAGIPIALHRSWQVAVGADHVGKFKHHGTRRPQRSCIAIVRRDGQAETEFYTVAEAIAFHKNTQLP